MSKNLELIGRLGFRPGGADRWCAACERKFTGAADAFKCRRCAEKEERLIHVDCLRHGPLPANR